jgi:Ca2+-binding RTX toxin-like protein
MQAPRTERIFTADEADRIAFLNSTGIYANTADGVTTTGVDDIDLWIGGLAEKQMPFGGMLGTTFGFIFENQLESLQNGDRFYYLSRTAGLHFGIELENNSFAKLVMLNTDATTCPRTSSRRRPSRSRSTRTTSSPAWATTAGTIPPAAPPWCRWSSATTPPRPGQDQAYLRYTGEDHVVLGGTGATTPSSPAIGDDTLWGDGGNDRLEGGYGNDRSTAAPVTTSSRTSAATTSSTAMPATTSSRAATAATAPQNLFGGDGNDFIITGEDISTTFGGGATTSSSAPS